MKISYGAEHHPHQARILLGATRLGYREYHKISLKVYQPILISNVHKYMY